ncbi:MAG TPA: D-hexose-6-phosphate mutarotase [Candidatus Sulfopaludibacter sp.]|jgi:glucose-6-phosphate 1-epimerase|nr:D-hexose-6-phosphate mutarotase [Candidatus Sulfopaludibacter sp.]
MQDAIRFEDGPGGLRRIVIDTPLAEGTIYLHGAHVTAWTPRGQRPVLFTSSRSLFEKDKPIRGGVPIVFPWFGPRSDGRPGPIHGFARISPWTVESYEVRSDGAAEIRLALSAGSVKLAFRVVMGASLEMELTVRNEGAAEVRFEEALHTYFAVADIRQVSVTGLEATTCIDKTDGFQRKVSDAPIRFTKETDQVHLNTTAPCEIHDPAWDRVIVVDKAGSQTTVVWNPWIEKTRTLADMAPDDWQSMVCVESANAMENGVTLAAGGVHVMRTAIHLK